MILIGKSLCRQKAFLSALVFALLSLQPLRAHEGMWIPSTLQKLIIGDMHAAGLKLSAKEIYSINGSSLKDAIVHFGGGCTAEVISRKGLILTNYHCGYGQIQSHSSIERDYLTDGFWAATPADELTNTGLTATFIVRIEDVTEAMLTAGASLEGMQRDAALRVRASGLIREATQGTHYTAEIKPFYYGNAFYMIVKETFKDVRLVGAPPGSIGKFGGDTDNWEWPRHTGDFALFRIYAGPGNQPAEYSELNRPYEPRHSLPINMDGLNPGDYTMVFGFPGFTEQYLTSDAVAWVLERTNPARKAMRTASLDVIDRAMASSDTVRIQYAAKQARIANAHKKWIGQSVGLQQFDALGKKRTFEDEFRRKAAADPNHDEAIPDALAALYQEHGNDALAREYFVEFYHYGPEVFRFAQQFQLLVVHYDSLEASGLLGPELDRLRRAADRHFKDYSSRVDKNIMAAHVPLVLADCPPMLLPDNLKALGRKHSNNGDLIAKDVFSTTVFAEKATLLALLDKPGKKMLKTLAADPAYLMATGIMANYSTTVKPGYERFKQDEGELMRAYVKATMELFPEGTYAPDANSTLRITFGAMEGTEPRDGVKYLPYTTLEGIAQKYIPGHRDFDVDVRLLELHRNRNYGRYATDGELRVCFLGSNHTTGGNSGSPALDAHGRLVGLNFDRTWESTMSDIMFNPDICRNIMVDIKYVLFIIDKLAGAGHLVEEMELVYTKQENSEKSTPGL